MLPIDLTTLFRLRTSAGAALLMATISCVSCAGIQRMDPGNPKRAPGPRYDTYFILDRTSAETDAVDQQVRFAVEASLADKAWMEVPPEYAHAVVVPHLATTTEQTLEAFYAAWGDWNWQAGGDAEPAKRYAPGTLVVDFFDAQTKRLVWRTTVPRLITYRSHHGSIINPAAVRKLREALPASALWVSDGTTAAANAQIMRSDPTVVFAQEPVDLVLVHGPPQYEDVPGTELQRIVNTRSFVLRDSSGMHYMRVGDYWIESPRLFGPWSISGMSPAGADRALARFGGSNRASIVAADGSRRADGTSSAEQPNVVVSTTPVVLVVTKGEPHFDPVPGTSLLRLANSRTLVVREPTDGELYIRAAGRWCRSWSVRGPWQWVPDDQLPGDFARIAALWSGADPQ